MQSTRCLTFICPCIASIFSEYNQQETEMRTKSISWGRGGRCVRLTTLPPSCAVVAKSWNLNFLEPSGPLRAYNGTAFYNQQDAISLNLFVSIRRSTCFRRFIRPSTGAQNCTYSVRYLSDCYCNLLQQVTVTV